MVSVAIILKFIKNEIKYYHESCRFTQDSIRAAFDFISTLVLKFKNHTQ
jgi:hypothetical protein